MSQTTPIAAITYEQWLAEAKRRYPSSLEIRFRCPCCDHVQTAQDYLALGLSDEETFKKIGFSCIGRVKPSPREAFGGSGPGPCNYAGGGLFCVSPIPVEFDDGKVVRYFDFADDPLAAPTAERPLVRPEAAAATPTTSDPPAATEVVAAEAATDAPSA